MGDNKSMLQLKNDGKLAASDNYQDDLLRYFDRTQRTKTLSMVDLNSVMVALNAKKFSMFLTYNPI